MDAERQVYRQSESIAPLKMPAGLEDPRSPGALMVPEVDKKALGDEPFVTAPPSNLPAEEETAEAPEQ